MKKGSTKTFFGLSDRSKTIIISIVIPLVFFSALELTQRIRYYFRSGRATIWLLYGFVEPKKEDYNKLSQKTNKVMVTIDKNNGGVYEIDISEKMFPNGVRKHYPEYPEYKGKVNSLGFVGPEFNPKKEPGIYRIIATGGSTTAGYESDIFHTYPALLERKLNKAKQRIEVINAGKGGVGLSYINDLLRVELVNYEPDMVTLYLTFNHLYHLKTGINTPRDIYWLLYKTKGFLSSKSLFFLTLREKIAFMRGQTMNIYFSVQNSKKLAQSFLNTPMVFSSYREGLERFADICKRHGIKPVFITEACVLEGEVYLLLSKDMEVIYKKMNEIVEDVAKKEGAIFINAYEAMDKIPDREKLFTDGLHLKPEGNEVLADIIYKELYTVTAAQNNLK